MANATHMQPRPMSAGSEIRKYQVAHKVVSLPMVSPSSDSNAAASAQGHSHGQENVFPADMLGPSR